MATKQRLTLAKPPEVDVVLSDPDAGLERVYRVVLFSRSVKEQLGELGEKVNAEVEKDNPDEATVIRLVCDQLNIILSTDNEDAPQAGDLLYAGWESEVVSDDQISKLYVDLVEAAADPT
jgi:hypothetical protein